MHADRSIRNVCWIQHYRSSGMGCCAVRASFGWQRVMMSWACGSLLEEHGRESQGRSCDSNMTLSLNAVELFGTCSVLHTL